MCEHGYRYYRIGGYDILDGRDPEFQRFVALFSKGVLHVSDVVRVASQRAVSKGMFRATGEHPAPESLGRLAEESLCLMLLF